VYVWQKVFVFLLSGLLAGLDGKELAHHQEVVSVCVANGICFPSKWSIGGSGWRGTSPSSGGSKCMCGKWCMFFF
jgi:hypothetical protein